MIAPGVQGRSSLLVRSLLGAVAGAGGLAIGWTMTRGHPRLGDWLLPGIALVSALLLAVEVFRTKPRRTFWLGCVCAFVVGRATYELVRLFLHR